MVPRPVALGLTLCDSVIVEQGTKKVSLIGSFAGMVADQFPFVPQPFSAFAALTDSRGDATIEISVSNLDTDKEIYTFQRQIHFPDRLTEVLVNFRIHQCSFPVQGWYQFALLVDGEWVAQRRVRVR